MLFRNQFDTMWITGIRINRIASVITMVLFAGFYCINLEDKCPSNDYACQNPNIGKIGTLIHGKCQTSNILRRLHGTSLMNCVKECLVTALCTSLNYRKNWQICDVAGISNRSLDFESGCLHSNISTWPKAIAGSCLDHTCTPGMTCVFLNGNSICQIAYCNENPEIYNADCTETFGLYRSIKHGIRFQCQEGFELRGRPFSVCQENGTWDNKFWCKPTHCYPDCSDLPKGSWSGVYVICPVSSQSVSVYCDMVTDGGGWTVFQRRLDGTISFFRNWISYENGFGDLEKEFWLGNKNISLLVSTGQYELYVKLEDFEGNMKYAKYNSFRVGDALTKYRLEVTGYSGNAGDSLVQHNNMYFSTYDVDNDVSMLKNCASSYRGAWWYAECHSSNLNGEYLAGPHLIHATGIIWYEWKGHHYSLKRTNMMYRKHN